MSSISIFPNDVPVSPEYCFGSYFDYVFLLMRLAAITSNPVNSLVNVDIAEQATPGPVK